MIKQKSRKAALPTMLDAIIVDDYDEHAEILEYHLKLLGVTVVAKGQNGMEAFELYKKHDPVFIFLDVAMPVYDGLFALEKIRRQNPLVTIVMITGDTSHLTKRRMNFLGASEILYKPIEPGALKSIVERERVARFNVKFASPLANLIN